MNVLLGVGLGGARRPTSSPSRRDRNTVESDLRRAAGGRFLVLSGGLRGVEVKARGGLNASDCRGVSGGVSLAFFGRWLGWKLRLLFDARATAACKWNNTD